MKVPQTMTNQVGSYGQKAYDWYEVKLPDELLVLIVIRHCDISHPLNLSRLVIFPKNR